MNKVCRNLSVLDPDLKIKVINITGLLELFHIPVFVFETGRSVARQKYLVKKGYSKTLKSLHISGEAVDFVVRINGQWSWDYKKYKLYYLLYGTISRFCGLRWGISWKDKTGKKIVDYPHSQIKEKV